MLTIRPARSSEAEALIRIGMAAWEVAIVYWGEDMHRLRANAEAAYTNFCIRRWPDILVGEWDGEVAGWGASENADDRVTDLWVPPAFQGRGIGTGLLATLEDAISARGYGQARLETHARNIRAIRLYKKLGYYVRAYMVDYSPSLDTDLEKVEMIKPFGDNAIETVRGAADDGLYGF